jgi:EmrB/QacA subfamily drug resistance transporter
LNEETGVHDERITEPIGGTPGALRTLPGPAPRDADGVGTRTPRLVIALVVIATAQLMVTLDRTIVNIALPSIQRSMGFSVTGLSWVINAYVLAFGGLLLLGGRTGDLFGRRRMLILGVGVFTAASLVGGLATSALWLVSARAVQGLGAAIAAPTALSLIVTTFPEGPRRHRAMAVYAGMSGAGGALGLLFGGILTEFTSWRWVFLVNVPVGVALVVLAPISLPVGDRTRRRLDVPGALLITASMTALVYGLEQAPDSGWVSAATLSWLVAAALLLAAFVTVERRATAPLVPLAFLAHRGRAAGYVMMLTLGGAMLSILYFLTQFLQNVLHYSALTAGVAYLPVPVIVGTMGWLVSRVIGRTGVRPFLLVGPLAVVAGMMWASMLSPHANYLDVFGPLVLVGLGQGFSFVPLTLNAVASVGDSRAGLASGLLNTSQQLGASVALAAIVSVSATSVAHYLAAHANAANAATHLAASIQGFRVSMYGGAIASAVAFLAALALPRVGATVREDPELIEVIDEAL